MSSRSEKAFLDVIKDLNKTHSKAAINKEDIVVGLLGDMNVDVERFSTGSFVLNSILGGGYPKGRIIEIYGPESSGKTTFAITALAEVQKEGGNAVFIDAEQTFDPNYATNLGVDISKLGFSQSMIAENVLQLAIDLANSGEVDLIVIDSVASLMTKADIEGGVEKQSMATLARTMSRGLPVLAKVANDNKCTIIFLNQIRDKVGVMFGSPEGTPGGRALKFNASQRIEIRRSKIITDDDNKEEIGTEVRLKCVKNKVSKPFGIGHTVITFAEGVNVPAELFTMSLELGILEVEGRTYWYDSHGEIIEGLDNPAEDGRIKIATSKAAALEEVVSNPAFMKVLQEDLDVALDKFNSQPRDLDPQVNELLPKG